MPNWCSNTVIFRHDSKSALIRLHEAIQARKLLEHLRPLPNGVWDYTWCIDNWGTKWEVDITDVQERIYRNEIEVSFESAWGPPIEIYYYAERELDYSIEAYYHELGCGILGEFTEGQNYDLDYPQNARRAQDMIERMPKSLGLETEWEEWFDED